jgi:hypothetical protein
MSYAQSIVKHLGGEWFPRHNYGLAPGPGHSKRDRSLKITPHATDKDDVVVHSFTGDDVLELKRKWREEGMLPRGGKGNASEPYRPVKPVAAPREEPQDHSKAERDDRVISWLWGKSEPAGAVVKTYFSSRRIELEPWPRTIRFLPASPPKHPYPAMLVPAGMPDEPAPSVYVMPQERIKGVHLTYLKPDGGGKAPVSPSRRMIGNIKGSPLALIPPNDGAGLLIAEGIETALSGHLMTGLGAWAAGSASFLPALADAVPPFIECVMIARERDPAGQRGADDLGQRLEERGIEVIMLGA